MLTSEVHPSGIWWDLPVSPIPLPGAPDYLAALFLPRQPSFSLGGIVTKGTPLALLGMQDVLPGRLQTPVGHLRQLSNPCATNPWKTAWERGFTAWVLTLLVAVSSNKVPWEKARGYRPTHKTVCVGGVSGSRRLQTSCTVVGSVLTKLTKNHLGEGPGVKGLRAVSHEEALLAHVPNSRGLCKGAQSVRGRERSRETPGLHKAVTKQRSKAVKKLR